MMGSNHNIQSLFLFWGEPLLSTFLKTLQCISQLLRSSPKLKLQHNTPSWLAYFAVIGWIKRYRNLIGNKEKTASTLQSGLSGLSSIREQSLVLPFFFYQAFFFWDSVLTKGLLWPLAYIHNKNSFLKPIDTSPSNGFLMFMSIIFFTLNLQQWNACLIITKWIYLQSWDQNIWNK